jgi:hypothetical protein
LVLSFRTLIRRALAISLLAFPPALVATALMLPASAGAYLYWESGISIGRADLNGRGIEEDFIPNPYTKGEVIGQVTGIATSGPNVYFAFSGGHQLIARANGDGGEIDPDLLDITQSVLNPSFPSDLTATSLTVGGAYIYWCTGEIGGAYTVGRAGIDGTGVEPDFIKVSKPVHAVAVDSSHVYWVTEYAIARASLDGTHVETELVPLHGASVVGGLAVADGHIYWSTDHAIARAGLGGHHIERRFITSGAHISHITIGDGYIYWDATELSKPRHSNSGSVVEWIARANLSGHAVQQHFIHLAAPLASNLAVNALGPGALAPNNHTTPNHRHRRR